MQQYGRTCSQYDVYGHMWDYTDDTKSNMSES